MTALENRFKTSVCSNIELEALGVGEYLVHTGFTYSDGDEFHIVLDTKGERWSLSDEGHTFMWLSYEEFNWTETREDLLRRIISSNSVELNQDEIAIGFSPDDAGPALYSLIQAIMQVSDLRIMSTDRVANTLIEDLKEWFTSSKFSERCRFGQEIRTSKGSYSTDILIDGRTPIVVLGITNVLRCKEAMITMLGLSEASLNYKFLIIIDEGADIPQKEESRAINRADRPIKGLNEEAKEIMERYIRDVDSGSAAV